MKNSNHIQNFERDMRYKNYASASIANYISQIKIFLSHFQDKDSPKHISSTEIKDYILNCKEVNSQRHMHSAIKLFYTLTIHQPMKFRHIQYARKNKKLPQVIDKDFLLEKIAAITNLKHRTIISLAYSVGLRVSEVINLLIADIDSKRMLITIRQAKGNKDRIVPLSNHMLQLFRDYYLAYHPKKFLFNGRSAIQYTATSCNAIVKKYLGSEYHFHTLRHSSFTTMLESGTDLRIIQKIAGHASSKTTEIYTHVSSQLLNRVNTPL